MQTIIYTDGSYSWQRDLGRFALIIVKDNKTIYEYASKAYKGTTHNRMEMSAILHALKFINDNLKGDFLIYSDSKYCVQGYSEWMANWVHNQWKTASGSDVLNKDIWKDIFREKRKNIKVKHVKGHAGIDLNEYVDKLCNVKNISESEPCFEKRFD